MILVAICTRERPKMLARLLETCLTAFQKVSEPVSVLIVENGPPTGAQTAVDGFAERMNIRYLTEQRLGPVYTRNAARSIGSFLRP